MARTVEPRAPQVLADVVGAEPMTARRRLERRADPGVRRVRREPRTGDGQDEHRRNHDRADPPRACHVAPRCLGSSLASATSAAMLAKTTENTSNRKTPCTSGKSSERMPSYSSEPRPG